MSTLRSATELLSCECNLVKRSGAWIHMSKGINAGAYIAHVISNCASMDVEQKRAVEGPLLPLNRPRRHGSRRHVRTPQLHWLHVTPKV
jgi:hypothetical protein